MCESQWRRARDASASVVKEEPKSDIPRMIVAQHSQKLMKRNGAECSNSIVFENDYNTAKLETRETSPLDTMAEVACRLGMELPLNAHRRSKESALPANAFAPVSVRDSQEHGSASTTAAPTQETISPAQPRRKDSGHEAPISLQSLLRILRRYNSESGRDGSYMIERSGRHDGAKSKKTADQFSDELNIFKDGVMTTLGNMVQEIIKVKAEVVSLQKSLESMQKGKEEQEDVVMVTPEDVGKVWFIVRPIERCEDDHDVDKDKIFRLNGNKMAIRVERKWGGKCERGLNNCMSSGSEEGARGNKRLRKSVKRKELRSRTEQGESMTESTCNSGKSDCDYVESGNKRSRNEGMGGKVLKGKGTKRRRDNWTEEENTVFMGMVLRNQEVEEMTLRRMLARRFSPRRTHEQCANHLRILRAQKKLPPARQEAVTLVQKDSK